jgi:metallo-beta-lactamase class B
MAMSCPTANPTTRARAVLSSILGLFAVMGLAGAQDPRAAWNAPQDPFRVFGNTHYVGPRGLSSILITSDAGHVLIDGALPESAPLIVANVRRLGFRFEDVKLILNSHVHYDHAGGIAELQRLSGAAVAATAPSARVLEQGRSGPDDPQYGALPAIAKVRNVKVVADGEVLRVGPLEVTAHRTGGHTPGGTSWTWRSCESGRCLDMVYADSVTAMSAEGFSFTRSKNYPAVVEDFEMSFAFLDKTPCDVLVTPHPEAADLWGRLAKREQTGADALVDRTRCRQYADSARARLRSRIEAERKQ